MTSPSSPLPSLMRDSTRRGNRLAPFGGANADVGDLRRAYSAMAKSECEADEFEALIFVDDVAGIVGDGRAEHHRLKARERWSLMTPVYSDEARVACAHEINRRAVGRRLIPRLRSAPKAMCPSPHRRIAYSPGLTAHRPTSIRAAKGRVLAYSASIRRSWLLAPSSYRRTRRAAR